MRSRVWGGVIGWMAVAGGGLVACGGGDKKVDGPKQEMTGPVDMDAVHEHLVAIHKRAVETCFGGFGKGAPYAVSMKLGKSKIMSAEATPIGDKHGEFPKDCVEGEFEGSHAGPTDQSELSARFAVDNPDCDRPACPPKDLPCTFKRDIACTVVID